MPVDNSGRQQILKVATQLLLTTSSEEPEEAEVSCTSIALQQASPTLTTMRRIEPRPIQPATVTLSLEDAQALFAVINRTNGTVNWSSVATDVGTTVEDAQERYLRVLSVNSTVGFHRPGLRAGRGTNNLRIPQAHNPGQMSTAAVTERSTYVPRFDVPTAPSDTGRTSVMTPPIGTSRTLLRPAMTGHMTLSNNDQATINLPYAVIPAVVHNPALPAPSVISSNWPTLASGTPALAPPVFQRRWTTRRPMLRYQPRLANGTLASAPPAFQHPALPGAWHTARNQGPTISNISTLALTATSTTSTAQTSTTNPGSPFQRVAAASPAVTSGNADIMTLQSAVPRKANGLHRACCFDGYTWCCYVENCVVHMKCAYDLRTRHLATAHPEQAAGFDFAKLVQRTVDGARVWAERGVIVIDDSP